MSLQKWSPFSMLENEDESPFVFNWPSFSQFARMPTMSHANDLSIWEDDNHVVVECSLPGINKGDAEVTFEKGMLTVSANSKEQEEDKKRKYFHKATRSFTYRLSVPGNIDESQEPKANLANGIMRIEFQKKKQSQSKKIRVQ